MKAKLEALKKVYDKKKVHECVKIAKSFNDEMIEKGEQLVRLLWYLEKTNRYKEYDGYEKIGFSVFVDEVCAIAYNRYRQLIYAYNWYPQESKEFGPQVIQSIRSKVGVAALPKVLKEIKQKTAKIDDPLKKREIVYETIKKYEPKRVKKDESGDTKAYWRNKHNELLEKYRLLEKETNELRAQLARQRVPLETFLKVREMVGADAVM